MKYFAISLLMLLLGNITVNSQTSSSEGNYTFADTGKLIECKECKISPIVCKLFIVPLEGVIKKVSFWIIKEAAPAFKDEDILALENVVLNTRLSPDDSMNGDFAIIYWPIGRKLVKQYLETAE